MNTENENTDMSETGNDTSETGNDTSETGNDTSETGNDMSETGNDTSETGNDMSETGNDTSETGNDTSETGNDTSETGNDTSETIPDAVKEQSQFNATAGRLRSFVERAERILEEKQALNEDLKEIFGEAKSDGMDVAAIKTIIKIRSKDPAALAEEEAILDTYKSALGIT